jgi:Zn-dependent protease with chaperone function
VTSVMLAACLGGAAVALGVAAGAAVMALAEALTRTVSWSCLGAVTRASLLAQARLSPLTFSLVLVPLMQVAFWRFEPAGQAEPAGAALVMLAAAGAWAVVLAAVRAARVLRATLHLAGEWRHASTSLGLPGWAGRAWVVRTPVPVVAVVGVGRAELFVSSAVIDACSDAELAAIAAHERAHVAGGDNLMRLGFALAPAAGPAAGRLERAWAATAEEIADLHARAAGDGVTLARALTKVARLALDGFAAPPLVASALIGGDSLERRVRRLLEPARHPGRALKGLPAAALLPMTAVAAVWGLPLVYEATEWLVRFGR